MPKFNERLKMLRQEKNLSQSALASQIGISKSSINMYERGEREPSIDLLNVIANYFCVDSDFLLGRSSVKQKEFLYQEFDKQFDVEKLEAETAMWDFIGKHYGEATAERLNQYLTFSQRDQEKISKLLDGYSKLDEEDRTILFARAYQILEDMLAADKYAAQKESQRA